jgi:endonuclease/exonuclease/phosphatase family metal-dependent hydrolase
MRAAAAVWLVLFAVSWADQPAAAPREAAQRVRVATFNVSLNRPRAGQLANELRGTAEADVQKIAAVLQRVRPDIVLLNEFDYDAAGAALQNFEQNYLAVAQAGGEPLQFKHRYIAEVNTGEPTGIDMNRDGRSDGPNDAYGFGRFPGQYGMVVLSQWPIAADQVRSFRRFLWRDMPDALLPRLPESGESYYSPEQLAIFRLSSKSHWDLPIQLGGRTLHLLACHPTPPAFDGPEDRHGCRNHDEIRLWADYIVPERAGYLVDDAGARGGLETGASFVIVGDLNSDPLDGDSAEGAIKQLLEHPAINVSFIPQSAGALAAAEASGRRNSSQRGDPRHDTADFSSPNGPGNLRVDYVLPSKNLKVESGGVFWPTPDDPEAALSTASDHHLVWIDLVWPAIAGDRR